MKVNTDIKIMGSGIAIIVGVTAAGIEWIKSHVNYENWQLTAGGIACEPSMAIAIREGAENDGLTVS